MRISIRFDKVSLFLLALAPSLVLVYQLLNHQLGPNPVETLTHETGQWALRILLISLAITPLRRLFRWNRLIAYRRMLGLFAFYYALLHFSVYLVFDHFFDWRSILDDVIKRPYITVGFSAFVLLIPLACTSFSTLQRSMGKTWIKLHRLVYLIGILSVVHFLWLVKADLREPLIYGLILAALLSVRLYYLNKRWQRQRNTHTKG